MIVKLKTRKNIYSSKQLVNYILTDKGKIEHPFEAPILLQNIHRLTTDTLHKDFLENHKFQTKRKGSIALYHEIVAIAKQDAHLVTKPMLQDLMQKYTELRGLEHALVLAKVHQNQHIHFMFGANEYRSKKRLRMSQTQMKKLLRDFETYHKEQYPQLVHSIVHTNKVLQQKRNIAQENKNHRQEKEYQLKLRTQKPTQKEQVQQMVAEIFENVGSFSALVDCVKNTENLQIYTYRNVIKGVYYQNRKYRFTTLGIPKQKIDQLIKVQNRLAELSLVVELSKSRGIER